jgi:hypothetical protein
MQLKLEMFHQHYFLSNQNPNLIIVKKRQLREPKKIPNRERKLDGEESEGINDASYLKDESEENDEEETATKDKRKKRAKTTGSASPKDKQAVSGTPNKKQAAKSAELKIVGDIARTENDFDKAFDAFKDELKYDESKINKSLLISKMGEMSAVWRLFKRQIDDYKKIK